MAELFRSHSLQSVNVVDLLLPEVIDVAEFDRLNESILALISGRAAQKWVVDLAGTAYLGSAMLGLIVNIRQQVKIAGGKLVICGLSPRLVEIFHTCSMERLFTIVKTRAEAIKTLGN